jgi:hypothetical protein
MLEMLSFLSKISYRVVPIIKAGDSEISLSTLSLVRKLMVVKLFPKKWTISNSLKRMSKIG